MEIFENFAEPEKVNLAAENAAREKLEDEKLSAFDSGYKSGWEDALSAHKKAREDFLQTLTDAVAKAELDTERVKAEFGAKVFPVMENIADFFCRGEGRLLLIERVVSVLAEETELSNAARISLACSIDDMATLKKIFGELGIEYEIEAVPHLARDQLELRTASSFIGVDVSRISSKLQKALLEFNSMNQQKD